MGLENEFMEVTDRHALRRVRQLVKKYGATVRFKDESRWMRCLGEVMFWSPRFSKHVTTVIGKSIWVPSRKWLAEDDRRAWIVLAHELVHVTDAIKVSGLVFSLAYLFPQCLALLAPLALIPGFEAFWWAILALMPFPAPFRAWIEYRGYGVQLACCYWSRLHLDAPMTHIKRLFLGGSYYFMWPFKGSVERRAQKLRQDIITGRLKGQVAIAGEIHAALKS